MVAIYMYFQQHSQFLLVRVSSQAGWTASRDTGHHCVQPRLRHCGVQRLRKGVGGSLDQQLGDTVVRRTVVGGVGHGHYL